MSALSDLVGRTLVEVRRAADGSAICLVDSTGEAHHFEAWGDCCANAYVESFDAPEFLLGEVTAATEDHAPSQSIDGDQVRDVTFYRLSTARGTCTIELRVEHNGYYGGNLAQQEIATGTSLAMCPVVLAAEASAKGGAK